MPEQFSSDRHRFDGLLGRVQLVSAGRAFPGWRNGTSVLGPYAGANGAAAGTATNRERYLGCPSAR